MKAYYSSLTYFRDKKQEILFENNSNGLNLQSVLPEGGDMFVHRLQSGVSVERDAAYAGDHYETNSDVYREGAQWEVRQTNICSLLSHSAYHTELDTAPGSSRKLTILLSVILQSSTNYKSEQRCQLRVATLVDAAIR